MTFSIFQNFKIISKLFTIKIRQKYLFFKIIILKEPIIYSIFIGYTSYNHNIRSMAWYNAAGLLEMGW